MLHPALPFFRYHRQPSRGFFVPFDEPVVLLCVFFLGLLRGGIFLDAQADQPGNYLDLGKHLTALNIMI